LSVPQPDGELNMSLLIVALRSSGNATRISIYDAFTDFMPDDRYVIRLADCKDS